MTDNSNGFPTQNNRDRSLPHNQLRPASLRSSGAELDECCGTIEQASAGEGLDAVRRILGDVTPPELRNPTGTNFTSAEQTSHHDRPNGAEGLPLMSEKGAALAAKTAPRSAFVTDRIHTSAVDKIMRGGR